MKRERIIKIRKTASPSNILLLGFILLVLVFFIIPEARQQISQYAHGADVIDQLLYYTPARVNEILSAYGEQGRQLYIAIECTADLFYWIVITAFLCSLMIWSSSFMLHKRISVKYLLYLPTLLFLSNCFENGLIIWMTVQFPEEYSTLVYAALFFTISKWLLLITCIAIIGWHLYKIILMKLQTVKTASPENV